MTLLENDDQAQQGKCQWRQNTARCTFLRQSETGDEQQDHYVHIEALLAGGRTGSSIRGMQDAKSIFSEIANSSISLPLQSTFQCFHSIHHCLRYDSLCLDGGSQLLTNAEHIHCKMHAKKCGKLRHLFGYACCLVMAHPH